MCLMKFLIQQVRPGSPCSFQTHDFKMNHVMQPMRATEMGEEEILSAKSGQDSHFGGIMT